MNFSERYVINVPLLRSLFRLSVRPSVCLYCSLMRLNCAITDEFLQNLYLYHLLGQALGSVVKKDCENIRKRFLPRVVMQKGYEKNGDFRPISFLSRTRQRIEPWNANKKSYAVYRMVPLSVTSTISNPDLKSTSLFDVKYLRNGTRERHSYNVSRSIAITDLIVMRAVSAIAELLVVR